MDPNAALAELRKFIDMSGIDISIGDVIEILDLIEALDEWLTKGGCLPKEWDRLGLTGEDR